jgi:diguanylate cyclase
MTDSFQFGLETLLVVSAVQFLLGAIAFWLFAGHSRAPAEIKVDTADLEVQREKQRDDTKRVEDAMQQMYRLTGSIGQGVGEHTAKVKQFSEAILDAASGDAQSFEASLIHAVAQMTEANEKLQAELHQAEIKMAEQAAALESQMAMARTDALTGVLNRRAFDDELERRVSEYQRYRQPVSLLLFDIDHFKKFNDTYGHQTGDDVLCHVACTLSMVMRDVDLVCRYGGEEFAIILPATDLAGAVLAAERARASIERMVAESNDQLLQVTVSSGVATVLVNEDRTSFVARADQALYASKKAGRNRVTQHDGRELIGHVVAKPPVAAPAPITARAPAAAPAPTPAPAATRPARPVTPPRPESTATVDREQFLADFANKDSLQSLPDGQAFVEDVQRRVEQHYRFESPVSILYCGIDGMGAIVGKHGAEAGVLVLRAVAQYLHSTLRDHDPPARISTNCFAIMLPGLEANEAAGKAELIRQAVEKCKLPVDGLSDVRLTTSIGVAEIEPGNDAQELIRRGTMALTAASQHGNMVVAERGGAYAAVGGESPVGTSG